MTDKTTQPREQASERRGFLTIVFRAPKGWRPEDAIFNHPHFSAASWSHALDDRDRAIWERDQARAALSAPVAAPEAPTCPTCKGFREVLTDAGHDDEPALAPCPACTGAAPEAPASERRGTGLLSSARIEIAMLAKHDSDPAYLAALKDAADAVGRIQGAGFPAATTASASERPEVTTLRSPVGKVESVDGATAQVTWFKRNWLAPGVFLYVEAGRTVEGQTHSTAPSRNAAPSASGCAKCGSTEIHACTGESIPAWTPEAIAEFDRILDEYETEPDRAALTQQSAAQAPLAHGHREDYYLLANARILAEKPIHAVRTMPNWVLASELFATGSTSARQICHDAGINPDGYKVERAAMSAATEQKEKP